MFTRVNLMKLVKKTVTIHPKISVCISLEMKPIFATSYIYCVVIIIVIE